MNQNPWFIEQTANHELRRIREDMQQIRVAREATKSDHAPEKPARLFAPAAQGFGRVARTLAKAILAIVG